MFVWIVLTLIVLIGIGVCSWALHDYRAAFSAPKPHPGLWSPAKLALVEHETGVHPLRRSCAEDGCTQCRMFVHADPTKILPLGDGSAFHPARAVCNQGPPCHDQTCLGHDPGPIDLSGFSIRSPNWQRRAHGLPELPPSRPVPPPPPPPVRACPCKPCR